MITPESAGRRGLGALSALVMGVALTALPVVAHADEADTTAPTVTVKTGDSFTVQANGHYEKVSFSLFDAGKVDKVVLNGVTRDLSNNKWSDLNFVKPGVMGAVEGENTLEVFDVAGNKATHTFTLSATAPTVTVKDGDAYTVTASGEYELVSFKLFDAGKVDKVVLNGVVKDLSNNQWSDLNFVKPGVFGALVGDNTLEVHDLAGNVTTVDFVLNPKAPTVTIKDGADYTVEDEGYELISFKVFDAGKVDKVVLNGVVKDLTNNQWSDLNFVKPGVFGGVLGENTLEVHDVAGNVSTLTFTLVEPRVDSSAPTITSSHPRGYITQGARLAVDPGVWTEGATLTYQWFRDGAAIDGATEPSLHLAGGRWLPGTVLALEVTGAKDGHRAATTSTTVVVTNARGQ